MKSPRRSLLAWALALLCLKSASAPAAGALLPEGRPEPRRAEPPPAGVPTTPENVHLPTEGEVRLGREAAREVEKQYRIVESGPYHERLQRVAQEVVAAVLRDEMIREYRRIYRLPRRDDRARRVPFEFRFRVLDTTREVNAFSLAGGPIYVTKGLMDYATSDDELAAVLAHECIHVTFHHLEQLIRKQNRLQSAQLWGLLAAVIAGVAGGGAAAAAAGNIVMGGQLVSIATLSGYGRELEEEADRMAIRALAGTRYHPVGMLTFMQKLARDDRLRANPDFGIFQSHPYSNQRVAAIRKEIQTLGYPVDLGTQRRVGGRFRIEIASTRVGNREVPELRLNGRPFFTVAAGEERLTPAERAEKLARQLDELFASDLTLDDVRRSADRTRLLLRGIPVLVAYPEDAAAAGGAAAAIDRAYREILRALWTEKLNQAE